MAKLQKYRISPTTWAKAQDLVITRPDIPLTKIAEKVSIPATLLKQKAMSAGWLNLRDLADVDKSTEKLQHIIKDLAYQINDFHEHTSAMIESLQFSHRIQIIRDPMGHIHYQNMPPVWPGKPNNFFELAYEEQQKALNTIEPRRLQTFINDMMSVLSMKASNLNFVTKMVKGSLPKIDPIALDLSRRDADVNITPLLLEGEGADDSSDVEISSVEIDSGFDPDAINNQLLEYNKRKLEIQQKIDKLIEEEKDSKDNE